jgi:hypothetical protein
MDMYKVMLKEWGFLGEKTKKKTHFEGAMKHKNIIIIIF